MQIALSSRAPIISGFLNMQMPIGPKRARNRIALALVDDLFS